MKTRAKLDLYEALSMDSTSIITQVNKEDELVEVNSYSQADKREYNLVFSFRFFGAKTNVSFATT